MACTFEEMECIRCVDARLREIEEGTDGGVYPFTKRHCLVWLAHHKEDQSWLEIARKFAPGWCEGKGKRARENQTKITQIRRAHDRVERHLNRSGDNLVFGKATTEMDFSQLILDVLSQE